MPGDDNRKCPSPSDKFEKQDKSLKGGKKPELRGLHLKQTLRHVYVSLGLAALGGGLLYFFGIQRRKEAYQNFYANYDANASFQRMQEAGLLSSCPLEPPEEEKEENDRKKRCREKRTDRCFF